MLNATTVTDEQIQRLRETAVAGGDAALRGLCDEALSQSPGLNGLSEGGADRAIAVARRRCAETIDRLSRMHVGY